MPEGHIIHHLARRLNREFGGRPVRATSPQGRFAAEAIDGATLREAEAWGKHLFLHFADAPCVHIHLGLIGKLYFEPADASWGQIRLHLELADAALADDALADADSAKVAANLRGPQWCRLITDEEYAAAKQGQDPIRPDARPEEVLSKVARSKRSIASLLMDQKLFAGVGNIYRAETLFRLQISPFAPGNELSALQREAIWADLVELMQAGVDPARIDTVRPEHTPEAMGRAPRKDDHGGEVYVYRRAGMPCYVCGSDIAQRSLEGRNLFWCPTCQAARA